MTPQLYTNEHSLVFTAAQPLKITHKMETFSIRKKKACNSTGKSVFKKKVSSISSSLLNVVSLLPHVIF